MCERLFAMTTATPGFPDNVPSEDLHWLAGLLEGEGTFLTGPPSAPRHPVLAVQMTDEDVVVRVATMFGRKASCWTPREARWQPTYIARVTGAKAVAWMTALRPLMGSRRQTQIDRAVASYEPRPVALLNDARAGDALAMLGCGCSVREVAARFGTSVWCIYDLRLGRTHKHLPR